MTRSKPIARATGSAKDRKPPETSRQLAPPARIVCTSVSAPAVRWTRSSRQRLKLALVEPGEQPHPLTQRAREIELALHRPLGDPRDAVLEPDIIGELVDAFLADDGRIHVGDEQPLPARLVGLDDEVDALERRRAPSARPWRRRNKRGRRRRLRRSRRGSAPLDQAREAGRARGRPACHRAVPLLSASQWPCLRPVLHSSSSPGRPRAASRRWRLALAQQIGGVIVNADSAQIYRDLPILSAAPSAEERARADHRLYGVQDGALPCSAADWAAMAKAEIADIHASGRTPILVGGTGLYLRTLLDGIAPVPAIDPDIRARVREARVEDNRAEAREARSGSGGAAATRRTPLGSAARSR